MLNQVEKLEEGQRKFDPGTFDLVIIDEAHRSVYNKYKAVIDYFDALLLGLTATPRDEVDRDTYQLFNTEQGNPTYAYELEEAVKEDFLVEYKTARVKGKFLSEGITYSELSEEEKKEYDDLLADDETGSVPKHIDPGKLNRWLFNKGTVDQMLKLVDRLSARPVWDYLEALERNEIVRELAGLIPADLYAPPFSFIDQDGIDGVFRDRDEVVDVLIEQVRDLNQIKIG